MAGVFCFSPTPFLHNWTHSFISTRNFQPLNFKLKIHLELWVSEATDKPTTQQRFQIYIEILKLPQPS